MKKEKKNAVKLKKNEIARTNVILPIMFIVFSLLFEISNYIYLGLDDGSGGTTIVPQYFLFDLGIILLIASIIFIVRNKTASQVIYYLFLTVHFVMNLINTTMYYIFGDILSVDLLKLGAEATTAMSVTLIDWGGVALNVAIYAVILTTTILLYKKEERVIVLKNFSVPVIMIAGLIMGQTFGLSLFEIQRQTLTTAESAETEIETSDEYLWDNFQFKLEAYKKFGYYGFYTKSIYNVLFKNEEVDYEYYSNWIDEGETSANENATLYGDNLIVILCESLDWYGIDPINTPTLYSIAQGNNSIVFDQFYARNRTNISEAITLLGSVPRDTMIKNAYEQGYNFAYSLPNLFKDGDENTVTSYFHPNTASFYNRVTTHGSDGVGFDNLYFKDAYTGDEKSSWGTWMKDSTYVSSLIDEFIPTGKRFLTYFASLSTHGDYDGAQKNFTEFYEIFDENYEEYAKYVAEETSFTIPTSKKDFKRFRNYKSAMIDLDRTVEIIINALEERGLENNTSIVLFADHNAYFSSLCYKVKGVEKSDFSNTYINNIPFMIYSPSLASTLEEHTISTFCSTYDILPTICDLYGLRGNSNLFQGHSIFSSEISSSIFASNLSGMFTNNIFSFNISDVYVTGEVSEEEIARFKQNANTYWQKQEKLEKIYKYGINGSK